MPNKRNSRRRKPSVLPQILICAAAAIFLLLAVIGIRSLILKPQSNPASTENNSRAGHSGEAVLAGALTESISGSTILTDASGSAASDHSSGSSSVSAASGRNTASEGTADSGTDAAKTRKWATPMERYYEDDDFFAGCPKRDVQLLTPNEYSRPQKGLDEVHDIVIHYVDEPGSTAQQNRDYFESLKDGSGRSVSSHFIISRDGSIIQCVPLGEVAYASNNRNSDTISIECCHPDDTGKFTDDTYNSCVDLTAWLCYAFQIGPDHVIRHYDVNGKDCPIYYVKNPEAWDRLKADVAGRYAEYEAVYGERL